MTTLLQSRPPRRKHVVQPRTGFLGGLWGSHEAVGKVGLRTSVAVDNPQMEDAITVGEDVRDIFRTDYGGMYRHKRILRYPLAHEGDAVEADRSSADKIHLEASVRDGCGPPLHGVLKCRCVHLARCQICIEVGKEGSEASERVFEVRLSHPVRATDGEFAVVRTGRVVPSMQGGMQHYTLQKGMLHRDGCFRLRVGFRVGFRVGLFGRAGVGMDSGGYE